MESGDPQLGLAPGRAGLKNKWVPWLLGAILVLGCTAIYWHVPEFKFVAFDDDYNLVFNPHLGPLSVERVKWAFTDWEYIPRVMPLGWLAYSAVFGWSGLDPAGWHVANLVLHVAIVTLWFLVLRRLGRRMSAEASGVWVDIAAFAGAALWAWHPLRVETVAWSSALTYGQAHLFLLVAVWSWLRAETVPGARALALLCYLGSLLTYPITAGFAPVFALLARREDHRWSRMLRDGAPFLVVAVAVLAANVVAQSVARGAPSSSLVESGRIFQALYVYFDYLSRWVWPVGLSPVNSTLLDYPAMQLRTVIGAVVFGLIAAAALAWRPSRGYALAYLFVLVPMLGLMDEVIIPADRYSALPTAVLSLALVHGLVWAGPRLAFSQRRWIVVAPLGLALFALGWLSRSQTEVWRDTYHLRTCIAERLGPGAAPAFRYVGFARWLLCEGRPAEALDLLDNAIARHPDDTVLQATRAEFSEFVERNRSAAVAMGLADAPPFAALLHWQLAARFALNGDEAAATVHLHEVKRIAPAFFAKASEAALKR